MTTLLVPVPRSAPRQGLRWTQEEQDYLVKAVRRGDEVERICDLLGRTYSGVLSQICRMYLAHWAPSQFCYAWNFPKAHRRGTFPRHRDKPIRMSEEEARQIYCLCRQLTTG